MSESKTPENVLFQMLKNGWSCDCSKSYRNYLTKEKFSFGFDWESLTHELLLDVNREYGKFCATPPEPLVVNPWQLEGRWEYFKKSEYFEAIKKIDLSNTEFDLIVKQIDEAIKRMMNEEPKA